MWNWYKNLQWDIKNISLYIYIVWTIQSCELLHPFNRKIETKFSILPCHFSSSNIYHIQLHKLRGIELSIYHFPVKWGGGSWISSGNRLYGWPEDRETDRLIRGGCAIYEERFERCHVSTPLSQTTPSHPSMSTRFLGPHPSTMRL